MAGVNLTFCSPKVAGFTPQVYEDPTDVREDCTRSGYYIQTET